MQLPPHPEFVRHPVPLLSMSGGGGGSGDDGFPPIFGVDDGDSGDEDFIPVHIIMGDQYRRLYIQRRMRRDFMSRLIDCDTPR